MGSDITEATCGSALGRIGSPSSLLLIGIFELGSQPSLNVIGSHGLDLSELTTLDHLTRLTHQRVPGVVVGQCKYRLGLINDRSKFLGLSQIECHRLIAYDMEACFQGGFGDFEVGRIGSRYRDKVNTLSNRLFGFFCEHRRVGGISPGGAHIVIGCRLLGAFRIA